MNRKFFSFLLVMVMFGFAANAQTVDVTVTDNGDDALIEWEVTGGGGGTLVELIQHDGATDNAYYQSYNMGYGVVYDLSAYSDAVVAKIDFHHLLWGLPADTWQYNVHIIDWTDYSVIAVVGPLSTTTNDDWELDIDLGNVDAGGTTQLGIFLEPLSNEPTDAYPDFTADNTPSGNSFRINDLSDIAGSNEASAVGDFLIDLWILTDQAKESVKVEKLKMNEATSANTRVETNTTTNTEFTQIANSSKDLQTFDVFFFEVADEATPEDWTEVATGLAADVVDYTDDVNWPVSEGGTYKWAVVANYDPEDNVTGISDGIEVLSYDVTFTVTDVVTTDPIVGATVTVDGTDVVTGDDGTAVYNFANGDYTYDVVASGYESITGIAFIVADDVLAIAVEMTEGAGINGINSSLNIYPNPSNGVFNVAIDGTYNLEIVDVTGKVVVSTVVADNAEINISNEAKGIYFLKFSNENSTFTHQIMVK